MKWLYISLGTLGGFAAVIYFSYSVYSYYHRIAIATSRNDIELDFLLVVGTGAGLLIVPVGVGIGLILAALIAFAVDRYGRYRSSDDPDGTRMSSWVTRRKGRG